MKNSFLSLPAFLRSAGLILVLLAAAAAVVGQGVPAPKDVLGFTPGDDRRLASWAKIVEYFEKLDAASDRLVFREAGRTTGGRPFTYAVISAPENLEKLAYYKEINDRLADPRLIGRDDAEAEKLIREGRAFVLITHGIHSTEVGSTLSSTLLAHRLAAADDEKIRKILDETIIVLVPSLNPDGVDIVKNWYDKTLGTEYEGTSPPELYHKYVGHDNNRDWYAFTQPETRLTVEKLHNEFHPQIVHDIHQQGRSGARFFVPPYLDPVEPNVPAEIIEGYTEIGSYIAERMRRDGLKGITTGSIYDAWTPARAYSHYHGGARILSETASARLATPVKIKFKEMTSRRGFDVKKASANYRPLWKGGKWGLRDITRYMTTGAFHLLEHAAANRENWLRRFYKIGREATRPRREGELFAFILPLPDKDDQGITSDEYFRRQKLLKILKTGGVEYITAGEFELGGKKYPAGTVVIPLAQPYGAFARAMLKKQGYPNLIGADGNPVTPYDVTAHNLALLMDVTVEEADRPFDFSESGGGTGYGRGCGSDGSSLAALVFRSHVPSMDEGWTRWVLENEEEFLNRCGNKYENVSVKEINAGNFRRVPIVFPDQRPEQILEGYKKGRMPEELTGGIGKEGIGNLKKFVEEGGTLVFLNRSADFAIEQFALPVENIAKNWPEKEFFIPGSILRTELDTDHPVARGMPERSIAWFERSPVFGVKDGSRVKVIARYPDKPEEILLSGWALGAEKIAGQAALVEVSLGRGRIILFGFRPQYRGQSLATFPLLFNVFSG